jgi:hypothetical protein
VTPSATPIIEEHAVTDIRIAVGDRTFSAQLADNPTARDLVDQLPLTLQFWDFNGVEKIAKLPRPLTMDGVPVATTPRSTTLATTLRPAIWFCTTAMSVTSTGSYGSVDSTRRT